MCSKSHSDFISPRGQGTKDDMEAITSHVYQLMVTFLSVFFYKFIVKFNINTRSIL